MRVTYKHEFSPIQRFFQKTIGMWRINEQSIDFKWGYFAPKFGLELSVTKGGYDNNKWSVNICLGWGYFNFILPISANCSEFQNPPPKYGIAIHNNIFWIDFGKDRTKSFPLPWFDMVFDGHWIMDRHGKWRKIENHERSWEVREAEAHVETYQYTYVLKSGEIQERTAKCTKEKRQWHRKWFPFVKLRRTVVEIEFDKEIGERVGTWKGGTIGCSYDIMEIETIEQCLRRMEVAREF